LKRECLKRLFLQNASCSCIVELREVITHSQIFQNRDFSRFFFFFSEAAIGWGGGGAHRPFALFCVF
jgi:hypothetical protein